MSLFEDYEGVFLGSLLQSKRSKINETYQFSSISKTGTDVRIPPNQTELNAAYAGTNLEGKVTAGPYSQNIELGPGEITISMRGGSGGYNYYANKVPGRGAKLSSTFVLGKKSTVGIMIGRQGQRYVNPNTGYGAAGGGMSALFIDNVVKCIAGGGGGSGDYYSISRTQAHANSESNGLPGYTYSNGGEMPNGGGAGNQSGGGAGISVNGLTNGYGQGGFSIGSNFYGGYQYTSCGGFGGGGACYYGGGGGGGAGGGGGGGVGECGGGGGSWSDDPNAVIIGGIDHSELGDGMCTITANLLEELSQFSLFINPIRNNLLI